MNDEMIGFHAISQAARLVEGGYKSSIPQNWKQGRTSYGGLTLALAYHAAHETLKPLPPLRSVQINFVGPVTDDPTFTTELLRQGRNVTSAQVSGFIDGDDGPKNIAAANFVFGAARVSELSARLPRPKPLRLRIASYFHQKPSAKLSRNFSIISTRG